MKKSIALVFICLFLGSCGQGPVDGSNSSLIENGKYVLSESPGTSLALCDSFQLTQWNEENQAEYGFKPGETVDLKLKEEKLILNDSLGEIVLTQSTEESKFLLNFQDNVLIEGCKVKDLVSFELYVNEAGDGFALDFSQFVTVTKDTEECPFTIETCEISYSVFGEIK